MGGSTLEPAPDSRRDGRLRGMCGACSSGGGNALVDRELQNRLEVRKYARVVGEVREVKALDDGTGYHLRGDLTLHGVTRSLEADVTLRPIDDKTIQLEGEKEIDMRDFGLNPPKLFIFRVYPEVQIKVRVVATLSS